MQLTGRIARYVFLALCAVILTMLIVYIDCRSEDPPRDCEHVIKALGRFLRDVIPWAKGAA